MTAQIGACESGQVAESIDRQLRLREVVTLFQFREERRGGGRPPPRRQPYTEEKLRIKVDRSVEPAPFGADLDSGFVDSDPPRSAPRRVWKVVGEAVNSLKHRLMRALDTE